MTVDDVGTWQGFRVDGYGFDRLPGFAPTWSLLTRQIIFGEALFPRFGLPVVILHSSAIHNDPSSKLTKHGFGRHDGNLPRSVRVRQDLLLDQLILLRLRGNDFEQRSVLVEQQIGVSIVQYSGTLGGEHEHLFTSIRNVERSDLESASIERMTLWRDLSLPRLIRFSRDIFVAFWCQCIGRVVPHSRERFQDRLGRRGFGRRGLDGRGLRIVRQDGRLRHGCSQLLRTVAGDLLRRGGGVVISQFRPGRPTAFLWFPI